MSKPFLHQANCMHCGVHINANAEDIWKLSDCSYDNGESYGLHDYDQDDPFGELQ